MIKPIFIKFFILLTFLVSNSLNAQKELPNKVVVRFNFKNLQETLQFLNIGNLQLDLIWI